MPYIQANEVAEIRKALKEKYGNRFKFSVRKGTASMSVDVSIISGDADFYDGDLDYTTFNGERHAFDGYHNFGQHHLDKWGKHSALFKEIEEIIRTAPAKAEGGEAWYDKSDSQSDYFHTAFYYDIIVGYRDSKDVVHKYEYVPAAVKEAA